MMTKDEMLRAYHARSGAQVYALGFKVKSELYVAKLTFEQLVEYAKLNRASSKKGGYTTLRIRTTSAQRKALQLVAEHIGSFALLETEDRYNKGERFERLLKERWTGKTWKKDSRRFDESGDITVDGIEIQVKLDNAELTNEKVLGGLA